MKYGGDVFIATHLDYVNLANVLAGVEARGQKSKVSGALQDAVGQYSANWGWEAEVYPKGKMAIFNVPIGNDQYQQHVMNTTTGSWCRFKDLAAHCWRSFDGGIYFGSTDGYVYAFDSGDDDVGSGIQSEFQTAWLPIGGYVNKMFHAVREFYRTNANIDIVNHFAVDYEYFADQPYPAPVESEEAEWGDPWGIPWGAVDSAFGDWEMIGQYGEVISMKKRLNTKQQVTLLGISWLYTLGGRL
jgi:hypothetical protein